VGGACCTYGESRGVYSDLERKPELKISLRRPRRKWEDNINMDLQEVELGGGEYGRDRAG
jgi:hypothetical protein